MLFPEFHYYGFKTSLKHKTKIYDLNDPSVVLPSGEEAYSSVYRFNSDIAGLSSLANLPNGLLAYPDYVLFDFDSKDLNLAFSDLVTLCERLDAIKVGYLAYFSGGKGFHLAMPSTYAGIVPTSNFMHIKTFAEELAQGLTTFDSSVYNLTRIFRCEHSYNLGGKLHKTIMSQPFNLQKTLAEAVSPRPGEITAASVSFRFETPPNQVLVDIYKRVCARFEAPKAQVAVRVISDHEPRQGGSLFAKAEEGRRNETAYTVARRLARRGIPLGDTKDVMLNVWNGKACVPPLSTEELVSVVTSAYSKGVNEFVDEGSYAGKIIDIKGGLASVSTRFQNQQTGFLTGYEMLDKYTMGFGPEELIWIVGRSGSFKSAVLTNILQRGSKLAKKPALFFSMEMGQETLIPRMIQQAEGLTKREVVAALRSGVPVSTFEKTTTDFEFLKVIHLSNLTTEQVLGLIDYHIETYGELSAVGFDYLGLFKGVNNNTERTAKQAQELKTIICKAARCPVFCLTQAKQIYEGREGDIELDRSCPKDSDSILDLGDYAVGLWGHWSQDQITGVETKFQFGRFFKSRGMDTESYGENPYFGLNLDKQFMRLNDVVHIPHRPDFKTKKGEKND